MTNPYPETFTLHHPSGEVTSVSAADFAAALKCGGVPERVNVSVKESRQRVKFNQVERFISAQLDFSRIATLTAAVRDPTEHAWAKHWALEIVEQDCLSMEDKMAFWLEAMFGKANVQNYMRDPNSPWVRGGNSALQGARLAGLVHGGGEKTPA